MHIAYYIIARNKYPWTYCILNFKYVQHIINLHLMQIICLKLYLIIIISLFYFLHEPTNPRVRLFFKILVLMFKLSITYYQSLEHRVQ